MYIKSNLRILMTIYSIVNSFWLVLMDPLKNPRKIFFSIFLDQNSLNFDGGRLGPTNWAGAVFFYMKGTPFYHIVLLFEFQLRILDYATEEISPLLSVKWRTHRSNIKKFPASPMKFPIKISSIPIFPAPIFDFQKPNQIPF
jgi:hypothetical protein